MNFKQLQSSDISKGQSAVEYLTTYGWMLLVVAIVGGAIFTTVQNSAQIQSTSGLANADVQIENFGVSSDDELGLDLRSGSGSKVVVSKVNISNPDTSEWVYKEFTGDNRVEIGGSKIFELPNVSRTDSSNELDVKIIYDSGGLSNLSVGGTVSGSLELTDSGSYEGLPEDDHQSISDGGSLSLMQTVNYTYDDSGDVQVNETTAGSDGYSVDLNNDFSNEVEKINILEMHGADGSASSSYNGGSGGLIENASTDVSSYDNMTVWVGETTGDRTGGWGRSKGGLSVDTAGAGGGGSTEIWLNVDEEFVAAADAGGGGLSVGGMGYVYGGGGGARGGLGGGRNY